MPEPVDTLFAPPGGSWRRLSPRYVTVRRLGTALGTVATFVPLAVAAWFVWRLWWVPALVSGLGVVWFCWRFVRARRWVESWGYCERDADLCVRHGLWARELLVVPFGRMQMVKVNSGPLLRAFGLASVQLVTASASTDAAIIGLPAADATALRDRLIERSDARGSGI